MHIKYIITLLFIIPFSAFSETRDSEWMEKMKTLNANVLHSSLPKISYENWLSSFVGEKN